MGFFDDLPAPPPEDDPYVEPVWRRVPEEELATFLQEDRVIHRGETFALVLRWVLAYSTGLTFELWILRRTPAGPDEPGMHEWFHGPRNLEGRVQVGVSHADGRRIAFPAVSAPPGDDESPEIVLLPRSGSGTRDRASTELWTWPIPAAGDLTLHFRWDAAGLADTAVALDGDALRAASARARPVWPPGA